MPRLSLKQAELEVLNGLLEGQLISLADEIGEAEDTGEVFHAEYLRGFLAAAEALKTKLVRAKTVA